MPSKSAPSKAGTKQTGTTPTAWNLPAQGLEKGFESLVQANAKAAGIWLQSWTKLADESAGFLNKRWKQDLDLVEKIWACRSPLELLQMQSAFMQKALADYMRETGKLADLETDASVAEMEALDEGAREACNPAKPSSPL